MEYYKLEKDLIINQASETPIKVLAGNYILTESTGELSQCTEAELESNIARIDADIVARDAQIEADRLAAEEAARLAAEQAQTTTEEPTI